MTIAIVIAIVMFASFVLGCILGQVKAGLGFGALISVLMLVAYALNLMGNMVLF